MDFLADTWVMWFIMNLICLGLVLFYRKNRRVDTNIISSPEEFSTKTVLLGFKRGEGDIFIGYIFAILLFSLALIGFVRWIRTIF